MPAPGRENYPVRGPSGVTVTTRGNYLHDYGGSGTRAEQRSETTIDCRYLTATAATFLLSTRTFLPYSMKITRIANSSTW